MGHAYTPVRFVFQNGELDTPLTKIFEDSFPSVIAAVNDIKQKDHRHMSALLTRTEAEFMINRVVRRLMTKMPDTFVATIHDSILTTPDQVEAVVKIIELEFNRLGIMPTLAIETPNRTSGTNAA